MRRRRLLPYRLPMGLIRTSVSVAGNLLFPLIFNSRLLFGGWAAGLPICGLATIVISARGVFSR